MALSDKMAQKIAEGTSVAEEIFVEEIKKSIQRAIDAIVKQEIENAKKTLEENLEKEVGRITVQLAHAFEVMTMRDRIVVEFKKTDMKRGI